MTNREKAELARLVKEAIKKGEDLHTVVKKLKRYGFIDSTVKKYYRIWNQKAVAPAWEDYEKAIAPAWQDYRKVVAPAREDYDKVVAPAREDYDKVVAAAEEDYRKAAAAAREALEKAT